MMEQGTPERWAEARAVAHRLAELRLEMRAFIKATPALRRALNDLFDSLHPRGQGDDPMFGMAVERWLALAPQEDGRTVLQRYVRSRGDLPAAERAALLRLPERRTVVLEVLGHDGDVVTARNLVDDLDYTVVATRDLPVSLTGDYVFAAVYPVLDVWTFTGPMTPLGPEHAAQAEDLALALLAEDPGASLVNPELRRAAEAAHAELGDRFAEAFGARAVTMAPDEAQRAFERWADGGAEGPLPLPDLTALADGDELLGVGFLAASGLFVLPGPHKTLELLRTAAGRSSGAGPVARARREVLDLLRDTDVPFFETFHLLSMLDAATVGDGLTAATGTPVAWPDDADAVQQKYRPGAGPACPAVTVLPERLLRRMQERQAGTT